MVVGVPGPQVLDACTDDLGETDEEVGARSRKLVATNESTVVTKPVPDAIVVKNGESD